jgi:hypothetical protein
VRNLERSIEELDFHEVRAPTILWRAVAPNCGNAPEWTTAWTSSYVSSDAQSRATEIAASQYIAPTAATMTTRMESEWLF